MEDDIATHLREISRSFTYKVTAFDQKIKDFMKRWEVKYNKDQINAIKSSLNNNITIITGGPGTGKTTIINAIVKLYIQDRNMDNIEVLKHIALLAPTGRASRKMAESTGLPAMTIHRYLKWNKENNDFGVNEYNKEFHKLIIVDEVSMIDTFMFSSLLKGLTSNIKLILVGDVNQLPSVGAGIVLNDLITSDCFKYCPLEIIYRQSENSYIPYLCRDIKNRELTDNFLEQKDDYNFLSVNNQNIRSSILKICEKASEKNLSERDIQVLAPMYKGENGIDNLNIILQKLFNPESKNKSEIKIFDCLYREGDKVLQLVNDPDSNVFNGDIGYIKRIGKRSDYKDKEIIEIDFDGNLILFKREDMHMIKHAYAISIHKSQGSEFNHVIMPISNGYNRMLYNRLIYTGVSRAKSSLVIIGSSEIFKMAINNTYSEMRKTDLKRKIMNNFL